MPPGIINSKKHIEDGGGGGPNIKSTLMTKMFHADLAFMFTDGRLDILKNRCGPHGTNIPISMASDIFSTMLSEMSFRNNSLKMFKEGLRQQIESAINIAIQNFHESRGK